MEEKKKIHYYFIGMIIITLLILFHLVWLQYSMYLTYPVNFSGFDNNLSIQDVTTMKGVFGDLLSGHAALLAFIWFIYGVNIQKKEFDILAKEHHAQSDIYEKQNQILISQWVDQWITNIQNNFKIEKEEKKENFYTLLDNNNNEIYVSSFKEQVKIIGEKKYLLANRGSEVLILKYLRVIHEIENTIQSKLEDKDLNRIFTSRMKNDFSLIKQQLMSYLLMYIGSQLLLKKYNSDILIDSTLYHIAKNVQENYFQSDKIDILRTKYTCLIDDLTNGKIKLSEYAFDTLYE